MTQERIEKPAERDTTTPAEEKPKDLTPTADKAKQSADKTTEQIDAALKENKESQSDVDDLMKEIDEVLEENAEEFVKNYVQRGGE